MFAKSPSAYLGIEEDCTWMILAVDFACACAFWEDENYRYEQAQKQAGDEAVIRADALDNLKEESQGR